MLGGALPPRLRSVDGEGWIRSPESLTWCTARPADYQIGPSAYAGFELLSVIRTCFPSIAVMVLSSEYTPARVPPEAICDAFLAKSPNLDFELAAEVDQLLKESPLRGSRPKATLAPVWIPRTTTGYIILTCPECLRSFSAEQPVTTTGNESCAFCDADVPFQLSPIAASPVRLSESLTVRSRQLRAKAKETIAISQKLRENRRRK
jgi:hypothetical protein